MPLLEMLTSVFSSVWALFNGVTVPGTNFSFGALFLGVLLARIALALIQHALGFGGSGGTSYRSGSARNPKVAKERRGDTH